MQLYSVIKTALFLVFLAVFTVLCNILLYWCPNTYVPINNQPICHPGCRPCPPDLSLAEFF